MLSTVQIVLACILGAGALVAIGFMIASFIMMAKNGEGNENANTNVVKEQEEEVNEIDLDAMLAKLEEAASSKKEEPKKEAEPQSVVINYFETKEEPKPEIKEEVKEEPKAEEVIEEVKEEAKEEPVAQEVKEEVKIEEVKPEPKKEEKKEPEVKTIIIEKGPEFDYRIRLATVKESQAKIEKDLASTSSAILKYERTIRRAERNQKMLDRKALELTNINLLMYSVTDIKNVDPEKKARQEELTAHIAELKASIQDAEEYIETNREKYENNLKLKEYLIVEQKRYDNEVKELEGLIKQGKFFADPKN